MELNIVRTTVHRAVSFSWAYDKRNYCTAITQFKYKRRISTRGQLHSIELLYTQAAVIGSHWCQQIQFNPCELTSKKQINSIFVNRETKKKENNATYRVK